MGRPDRTAVITSLPRAVFTVLLRSGATLLTAGLLATALVGYAPGFGVDEKDLDPRFSGTSSEVLVSRQAVRDLGPLRTYAGYLGRLSRGDFGVSQTFSVPVARLLRERAGVTARNVAIGLVAGWFLSFLLCFANAVTGVVPARLAGNIVTAVLLCVPAGLIAFGAVAFHLSAGIGIAAVVFPRVFRYSDNLLRDSETRAHVLAARARGISEAGILFNYIVRDSAPHLLALAGVTANLALGAAIPMEVLCDDPGIGQLAWRAALGRDLDLVVAVTLIMAAVTLLANRMAGLGTIRVTGRTA